MNPSPEWQVCNLELAKKLKDLKVKQESLFYWCCLSRYKGKPSSWQLEKRESGFEHYSAFTVVELLQGIPKIIECKNYRHIFDMDIYTKNNNPSYLRIFTDECIEWCVAHGGIGYQFYSSNSDDPNLANVLAGMRIHLIEMGVIEP